MTTPRVLLIILAVTELVACAGGSGGAPSPQRPGPGVAVEKVDGTWTADQVKISCSGVHCRPQIGILGFLEPKDRGFLLHRCTATLIGPDRVLSSYHCVKDGLVGYFILPSGVRRTGEVMFKAFSGDGKIAPDAVILRLDKPFDDVTPLVAANDGTPSFDSLEAVVANQGDGKMKYVLDRVVCRVINHPVKFPFDITENPDLIYGFGCRLIEGNSGSPMFAAGDDRVQAIVQQVLKDDPDGVVIAANPRCFGNHSSCARVTERQRKLRRREAAAQNTDGVAALGAATRASFPTDVTLTQVRLAEPIEGRDAFEVYDLPKCVRRAVNTPKEIKFLNQLITFDGEGQPVELRRREFSGRVLGRNAHAYRIEVRWPEPFAPLAKPEEHVSRRADLTSPFIIDLPGCPR